jgi:hypothetical protein
MTANEGPGESEDGGTAGVSLSPLLGHGKGRSQDSPLPWRLVTYFLILIAWVAFIPNMIPNRDSDRGIFVSVAERLLAGDVLYKDVLDNKEPLFYYFVAAQRLIGAYGEIFGELVVFWMACYCAYKLSRAALDQNISLLVGWILVPFILIGQHYRPGYTELPGVTLMLLLIYSLIVQRWLLAGVFLAILAFTKLPFVPLGLASLAYLELRAFEPGNILRTIAGFLIAAASVVLVLTKRAEFRPLFDYISYNFEYSNNSILIPSSTVLGRIYLHLNRVLDLGCMGSYVVIVFISLAGIVRRVNQNLVLQSLSWLTIALAITSFVVLAFTGLWDHHVQIVLVPAVIAVIVFVGLLRQFLPKDGDIPIVMLGFIAAFFLGGAPFNYDYPQRVQLIRSNIALLDSLPLEAKYMREASAPTTYARLGDNRDDGAHAVGLRDWKLICRKFHQYWFGDIRVLEEVVKCIANANILIIAASFRKDEEKMLSWDNFVDEANAIVNSQYDCQVMFEMRICKRRSIGGN